MTPKLLLKMLAPYFSVLLFWNLFSNGWLAILGYHLALPTLVAGPLVYWLLPHITHTPLPVWLADHHLSRLSLFLLVPYFGLLHPYLEQNHWAPLRQATPLAHLMFAGYHMLVLYSLLTLPWLIFCFFGLATASFFWHQLTEKTGSLTLATLSHILADFGIILTALLITAP